MTPGAAPAFRRYAVALLCVAAGATARQLLDPLLDEQFPYIMFFPAVVVAAAYGGLGAALFAAIASYLVADYFFIPPHGTLKIFTHTPQVALAAAIFFLVALMNALVSEYAHRASRRAEESSRETREKAAALEAEIRQRRAIEDRFRIALSHSPITVYNCDRELRYTWMANPPEGFSAEDALGKRDDELLPPAMAAGLMDFKRRVIETGEGGRYELAWSLRGVQRVHEVTAEPLRDARGAVVGITAAAVDVSDRVSGAELRSRLGAIVESSDDGIVGKNLDGIIISWNAGAERLFGYSAEEAIGRAVTMLLPTERLEEEPRILAALCRDERIDHFETVRVRKDGTPIDVSISVSPIKDGRGRVVGAAKVARDVTLRKRAEREREELLRRAEAARATAEAASRAKDTFLATVSHELRTPLSPILAWATMLRTDRVPPERTAKAYETIERCARSQAQLIEDLLDISRIVAGKLRLRVAPVALDAIIEAAVDVVRPAADAKDIRVCTVLDSAAGRVSGDRDRLQQVLWNLLSNAIKFTPRSGRVDVTLARVDSHVEIAVQDTGKGIEPDFLPHIFGRFAQGDSSSHRAFGGLGLGLAIARHIVELHGGTIHAESGGEGQGAVFTVKLSSIVLARSADEPRRPTEPGDLRDDRFPRLEGVRVLLVDDEPDSNEAVRSVLVACGAEVRVAGSTRAAMDSLRSWTPDVLVSDVGMPEEDGYALISRLRAENGPLRGLPAIALTAYATVDDRVRLLSSGFQTHVPKPVEPIELVMVIANAARTAVKS